MLVSDNKRYFVFVISLYKNKKVSPSSTAAP